MLRLSVMPRHDSCSYHSYTATSIIISNAKLFQTKNVLAINKTIMNYFTSAELFSRTLLSSVSSEYIYIYYNRMHALYPVVDIYKYGSNLFTPFWYVVCPAISWHSSRCFSHWLDRECFVLGCCWCHFLDV